ITLRASISGPITSNTISFNVVPGAATQVVLSGLNTDLAAGAKIGRASRREDAQGNTVTGFGGPVTFAQTSGTGTVSGLGSPNAVAGVASDTLTCTIAVTITLRASISGPINSNSISFNVVPGAATQVVLSGLNTDLAAGA